MRARADDGRRDGGVVEHEREREVDQRQPGLVGERGERVDGLELALVGGDRTGRSGRGCAGRASTPVTSAPLRHLPRQPAAGERAPGDDAHAVALAGRQHVGLDAAVEQGVRRLLADEALAAARSRATHCASTICEAGKVQVPR